MARVEKTIDVNVPVRTAYDQWTQFEDFPRFMEGVREVRQLDDRRLRWRADVGGRDKEWDAEIREQVPDEKVIWRNTSGTENAGIVTFAPLGPAQTRVHLEMSYDPEGFMENTGDKLGFMSRRVAGDLQRFKDYIEEHGQASGAWRGEIHNADAPAGHTEGRVATEGPLGREGGSERSVDRGSPITGLESGTQRATEPGALMTDYPNPPREVADPMDGDATYYTDRR